MVAALGGPDDFLERFEDHLPAAPVVRPVFKDRDGYVAGIDARAIGSTLVQLGGGRTRPDQVIDLSVGLSALAQIGDTVEQDAPVCLVHARDEESWHQAAERARTAIRLSDDVVEAPPIVLERLVRAL
jgi:thymidine phosphorylase